MPSLDDHFHALTRVRAPEDWPELEGLEPRPLRSPPEPGQPHRLRTGPIPRRRHRVAAAGLAFAVAAAGTGFAIWAFGRASQPPPPGPASGVENGQIAFVRADDGNETIELVDPDGLSPSRLVRGSSPAWSPDGSTLVFVDESDGEAGRSIATISLEGRNVERILHLQGQPAGIGPQAWSPDGTQIVFAAPDGIHVTSADGTGDRRVTQYEGGHACFDLHPSWSPDGSRIVFAVLCEGGNEGLWTVAVDGSGRRPLIAGDYELDEYRSPIWSPDGTRVAFVKTNWSLEDPIQGASVYVVGADGSGATQVASGAAFDRSLAWSPDGRVIAFTRYHEGGSDIFLADLETSEVTQLTYTGDAVDPAWQAVPAEEASPGPSETTPSSPTRTLPEGTLLLQLPGREPGRVEVLDREGAHTIPGDDLFALDLSPDGSKVLVTTWPEEETDDAELLIVDLATGEPSTIATSETVSVLGRWSPDGSRVAYRDDHDVLCVVDLAPVSERCMPELDRVYSFDWAPDSRRLVLGLPPPEPLTVLDVVSGEVTPLVRSDDEDVLRTLEEVGFGRVTHLQFESPKWSASGDYVATLAMVFETVGGEDGNVVLVFDTEGNLVVRGEPMGEFSGARGWSPTADVFAYGWGGAPYEIVEVRTLDAATGEDVAIFTTENRGRGTVRDLAWSPSGRWVAIAAVVESGNGFAFELSFVEPATGETMIGTIGLPEVGLVDWGP